MAELRGAHVHITGIVQGVGFRPFVYNLAQRLAVTGTVSNTSAGVDIEVDGESQSLDDFLQALRREAPPLAAIDRFEVNYRPPNGYREFTILASQPIPEAFQPVSPDVTICDDCRQELGDPGDRRYHYPFINCTNCGPRFTIIADIPYDRPNTTMAAFPLCEACAAEYNDPHNRRFHAQPVACPRCGPHAWLEINGPAGLERQPGIDQEAIQQAQALLRSGKILAIKGLGGFHLACDALNPTSVVELRRRKLRVDKPFALMMPSLEVIEQHCYLNAAERQALLNRDRPIVILRRRPASPVASQVTPGQNTLGVMLPYTPLHILLFTDLAQKTSTPTFTALVMTSGNLSEEPIAKDNHEARQRLINLADAFLLHDRPIQTRCDDSVTRVFTPAPLNPQRNTGEQSKPIVLRRARGLAPFPVLLPEEAPEILAAGPELKNTFCLTRGRYAFISHHIGDMQNYETYTAFEEGITHFERLFRIHPQALAYDLHPDYLATRYALQRAERENLPAIGVQHHHAHIASCLAENGYDEEQPVIGVAFDGTGYGTDGAIWGGEFLVADYQGFHRYAHLPYLPLPGGDAAVRKPARIALAYLWKYGYDWSPDLSPVAALRAEERAVLRAQLNQNINSFPTSSMGRLFDAVAALAGVRQRINYEAQAAIELEALVDESQDGVYPFGVTTEHADSGSAQPGETAVTIDLAPTFAAILADLYENIPVPVIAARFHNGVAQLVLEVCALISSRTGIRSVALSGGVWQNMILLDKTTQLLLKGGFTVYTHGRVPSNDGGLSLGQAVIAARYQKA